MDHRTAGPGGKVNFVYLVTLVVALMIGFVAGLLTLRAKNKWCPQCGTTLSCLDCEEVGSGTPRHAH